MFFCVHAAPAPIVHFSPGGRRIYYFGEDLNVTCISSLVGAVFSWRAVSLTPHKPLILPNTTVRSGSNTSVLILRPIRVKNFYAALVDFTCEVAFPENMNIIGSTLPTIAHIRSEIKIITSYD